MSLEDMFAASCACPVHSPKRTHTFLVRLRFEIVRFGLGLWVQGSVNRCHEVQHLTRQDIMQRRLHSGILVFLAVCLHMLNFGPQSRWERLRPFMSLLRRLCEACMHRVSDRMPEWPGQLCPSACSRLSEPVAQRDGV